MDEMELSTTFTQPKRFAVTVQNAYKRYSSRNVILNGLNLNVPDASIYGLLGPSGCGKTTLLNCIVGHSKLDFGSIKLKADRRSALGYMPQTLSIHERLSIFENIYVYGRLYGLSNDEVKSRAKELIDFLELPSGDRIVTALSEGQRRRVSLAITFIHKPQILILDEPTVGLDLILSHSVWKRLLEMADTGTTIIITTHYIQEAQNAHTIGLMRDGVLLAEENPLILMEKHDRNNLEDVFLLLSQQQERQASQPYPEVKIPFAVHYRDDKIFSRKRVKGILFKDLTVIKRGFIHLLILLMLPPASIYFFGTVIGNNPTNLTVAVINEEYSIADCNNTQTRGCFLDIHQNLSLSCLYVDCLRAKTYKIKPYWDNGTAMNDFKKKKVFAVLYFPENYTRALTSRFLNTRTMKKMNPDDVTQSIIDFWVDSSNIYVATAIKMDAALSMFSFLQQMLSNCNINPKVGLPPVSLEKPVYGSLDESFSNYVIIPMLAIMAFTISALSTATFFLTEIQGGIVERMKIAGVSIFEMVISFFSIQITLTTLGLIPQFFIVFGVFDNTLEGSFFIFSCIIQLLGISGILLGTPIQTIPFYCRSFLSIGFLLAVLCDNLWNVTFTMTGINGVLLFFTGVIRPLEEQQTIMRTIGNILPVTWTMRAMNAISFKGYSITSPIVVGAIVANLSTIAVQILLVYCVTKYKNK